MGSTRNTVPKCKESTKGFILLSYHVVGDVLITDCSKKTIWEIPSLRGRKYSLTKK
jgi:hypothetical protein